MNSDARRGAVALVATVALAGFCAFHWANLVVDPPVGRVVSAVAIAGALGAALLILGARGGSTRRRRVAASGLTAVALVAGVLAAGLDSSLLLPGHWDELGAGVSDGISGLGGATYPYDEGGAVALPAPDPRRAADPHRRHGVVLLAPARQGGAAAAGLGVLVSAYGFASVLYAPGLPLLHGLVLLALLAACLWAPDLRGTRLALAGACVALAAPDRRAGGGRPRP